MARHLHLSLLTFALAAGAALGGCASTGGGAATTGELAKVELFAPDGKPRVTFYYSCAGSVAMENELCSAPAADFGAWASERQVRVKRVPKDAFDEQHGVAADKLFKDDTAQPYRVFVRFAPIAIGSYSWALTSDVKGGYTPPRAGFSADVFVFGSADGQRVAQTHLQNKSDAKEKGDPTPFVHDGAAAVLAALTPKR